MFGGETSSKTFSYEVGGLRLGEHLGDLGGMGKTSPRPVKEKENFSCLLQAWWSTGMWRRAEGSEILVLPALVGS